MSGGSVQLVERPGGTRPWDTHWPHPPSQTTLGRFQLLEERGLAWWSIGRRSHSNQRRRRSAVSELPDWTALYAWSRNDQPLRTRHESGPPTDALSFLFGEPVVLSEHLPGAARPAHRSRFLPRRCRAVRCCALHFGRAPRGQEHVDRSGACHATTSSRRSAAPFGLSGCARRALPGCGRPPRVVSVGPGAPSPARAPADHVSVPFRACTFDGRGPVRARVETSCCLDEMPGTERLIAAWSASRSPTHKQKPTSYSAPDRARSRKLRSVARAPNAHDALVAVRTSRGWPPGHQTALSHIKLFAVDGELVSLPIRSPYWAGLSHYPEDGQLVLWIW